MEGLNLAGMLNTIQAVLPAENLGWVFPDDTTAAVLVQGRGRAPVNLVFSYRPPEPVVFLTPDALRGDPETPFQRYLQANARGNLQSAGQLKLDRVALFAFAEAPGFRPAPALTLVFELTGRNTNLIVLESAGEDLSERMVLAVAREVRSDRNRYREVRPRRAYTPPPPYDKLDPRWTPDATLSAALAGLSLRQWPAKVDGIGPGLVLELARRVNAPRTQALDAFAAARAISALRDVIRDPSSRGEEASSSAQARAIEEHAADLRDLLRPALAKRVRLLERQLGDVERAHDGVAEADRYRRQAEALLAYSHLVERGVAEAIVPDPYGGPELHIALDPTLSVQANANALYSRAKRRGDVLVRLLEREPVLVEGLSSAREALAALDTTPTADLEALIGEREGRQKPAVGARHRTSGGFDVLVGRNSRENDLLTFRIAKRQDYWCHAQGYPGSHVVLRAAGRPVPNRDLLEAASLAAFHSKARNSTSVPVDCTLVSNIWKPKGGKAGAVHYRDERTLWVRPLERPETAASLSDDPA